MKVQETSEGQAIVYKCISYKERELKFNTAEKTEKSHKELGAMSARHLQK